MIVNKKTIKDFLNQVKEAIVEFFRDAENAAKERLKKLLIASIITLVLVAVAVAFIGTAVIFIIIGVYTYLALYLPHWLAWILMGVISVVVGAIFLTAVVFLIRKQLKPTKKEAEKPATSSTPALQKTSLIRYKPRKTPHGNTLFTLKLKFQGTDNSIRSFLI